MPKLKPSTREWRRIARGPDVLFHICSRADKRGKWTEEDFYAAGKSDWEDFSHHWRNYWPDLGGTCVEIGCGAGRLTHVLAKHFERVIAVDVSNDMIAKARSASGPNAEFHQVNGAEIPILDSTADGAFSVHVFQHLEDETMVVEYLTELRRVLRPGGTFMVHITIAGAVPTLRRRVKGELQLLRSRLWLLAGREHDKVRMNYYRYDAVLAHLDSLGFEDLELRVFATRSDGFRHSFFFGSVPSTA